MNINDVRPFCAMNSSVINLCSLVVDRYIAVVKPLIYLTFVTRRRVIQMTSLSWGIPVAVRMVHILNTFLFKNPLLHSILIWITVVLFELVPCLMLIFSFLSMLYVIRRYKRGARARHSKTVTLQSSCRVKSKEKSAVKMMTVIIGLFLLCYGFYIRCSFIMLFTNREKCNDEEYKVHHKCTCVRLRTDVCMFLLTFSYLLLSLFLQNF